MLQKKNFKEVFFFWSLFCYKHCRQLSFYQKKKKKKAAKKKKERKGKKDMKSKKKNWAKTDRCKLVQFFFL